MDYIYCITNLINNKQRVWNNGSISSSWDNASISDMFGFHYRPYNTNSPDNLVLQSMEDVQ